MRLRVWVLLLSASACTYADVPAEIATAKTELAAHEDKVKKMKEGTEALGKSLQQAAANPKNSPGSVDALKKAYDDLKDKTEKEEKQLRYERIGIARAERAQEMGGAAAQDAATTKSLTECATYGNNSLGKEEFTRPASMVDGNGDTWRYSHAQSTSEKGAIGENSRAYYQNSRTGEYMVTEHNADGTWTAQGMNGRTPTDLQYDPKQVVDLSTGQGSMRMNPQAGDASNWQHASAPVTDAQAEVAAKYTGHSAWNQPTSYPSGDQVVTQAQVNAVTPDGFVGPPNQTSAAAAPASPVVASAPAADIKAGTGAIVAELPLKAAPLAANGADAPLTVELPANAGELAVPGMTGRPFSKEWQAQLRAYGRYGSDGFPIVQPVRRFNPFVASAAAAKDPTVASSSGEFRITISPTTNKPIIVLK